MLFTAPVKVCITCRWQSFPHSHSSWYHHTHTHTFLSSIYTLILCCFYTFLPGIIHTKQMLSACIYANNLTRKCMPTQCSLTFTDTDMPPFSPGESYLKESSALWQHVCKAGLLFSAWERTCVWQWCMRGALFPIDALCCSMWKQNMVNLWKWLGVKSSFSKVKDSERRQWMCDVCLYTTFAQHMQLGAHGGGNLGHRSQWWAHLRVSVASLSLHRKNSALARRPPMTLPLWADKQS